MNKAKCVVGKILPIIFISSMFGLAIIGFAQDKPSDAIELNEIDRLKYENMVLSMSNLQLQMQAIQRDGVRLQGDLKMLKDGWWERYDLDPKVWAFNDQTMKFERKSKS